MQLFIKALIGAAVVVLIQLLTRRKNCYIAGLVPLFPTFVFISRNMVGSRRARLGVGSGSVDRFLESIFILRRQS